MSSKFKSQASSARAAASTSTGPFFGVGSQTSTFQTLSSPLSYVTELPDFSIISDPSIVVAFKNLTKKDSVTKAKALEDLQEILSNGADDGPESAVLEAWINIYPRISVDNARKVRQLAHSLQGSLTAQAGKRIAPQLSKVIGAWLAGTLDCDKSVSRVAREALETAFTTELKRKAIWRIYQRPLLEYVENALLRHTPQTLSDERITSPDDAEAKFVRVASTAILLLDELLQSSPGEEPVSTNDAFQAIISAKGMYEFASHRDSSLRRAVYKLLRHAVDQGVQLEWRLLSTNLLAKGLHISQTSSSGQFIDALLALTRAHPAIWTIDFVSKTSVSRRLHQFLRQGSHRGPESWWPRLRQLIELIPIQAWSDGSVDPNRKFSYDAGSQLLRSLHEGVMSSDEPRQNRVVSWPTYVDIFFWTVSLLDEEKDQTQLWHSFLYPIIEQYLHVSPHLSPWSTPTSVSLNLCSSSVLKLEALYPSNDFGKFYEAQMTTLVETMFQSESEIPKNPKQSQDEVIEKCCRFLDLQTSLERKTAPGSKCNVDPDVDSPTSPLSSVFSKSNLYLVGEAIKLLHDRLGRPYGAAGAILVVLEKKPSTLDDMRSSSKLQILSELLDTDAPGLFRSPSSSMLISIVLRCRFEPAFEKHFDDVLRLFLREETLRKSPAYRTLLRGITNDDFIRHPQLEQQVSKELAAALGGDDSRWPIIHEILSNPNLNSQVQATDSMQRRLLQEMFAGLSLDGKEANALSGFDLLLSRSQSFRQMLPSHMDLSGLMNRLLLISESPQESTADTAARLASLVKKLFARQGGDSLSISSKEIVRRQLEGQDEALPILSVVEIAREAIEDARRNDEATPESAILPTADQWQQALSPFLQLQCPSSIALTSPLQGFVSLVDRERRPSTGGLPRDSEGFSVALRLAIFVTKLLENISLDQITIEQRNNVYLYYPQALQLAEDKLGIESANALWIDSTTEVVQEVTDIVDEGHKHINAWLIAQSNPDDPGIQPNIVSCWLSQIDCLDGDSAESFNLGRTFTTIMGQAIDLVGTSKLMGRWNQSLSTIQTVSVKSAAIFALCRDALANSTMGKRLCNQLVSDATEADFNDENDAIRRLAFLNLLIKGEEDLIGSIPSQRLIFLTKHLLSISSFRDAPPGLKSELLYTLSSILPAIKELYGEFWATAVDLLDQYLGSVDDVSQVVPLHASLRLYACFLSLMEGDCNEDLQEDFSGAKSSMESSLIDILTLFNDIPSGANRPLEITAALLARQVRDLKFEQSEEITELYSLLSSENCDIQGAAYGILHRSIPSIGERHSVEAVLSKTTVHLPEELLSLLLDVPSMDALNSTVHSADSIWINVRQYLLSWKVVFDHFSSVSHVIRQGYNADIKDHGQLDHLLNSTCKLLRIVDGRPVDASKFHITNFKLDNETALEKESQWLSIHLYYLSLLYLPGLSKSWWIEQKNRLKTPVESWSKKHICPLVITACLADVSDWHTTTHDESEDHALSVKTNPRASEIIASIPVDPDSPPIALCITLPPSYPFNPALVTSRTRVGIAEQKWQSWLRMIQGVIMFGQNGSNSNNVGSSSSSASSTSTSGTGVSGGSSLIDGLQAFRHNVQALLKGQAECAICYSVVAAGSNDMKTPDKKCGTCKNMFHSACLYRWFRSSNSSSCPLCRNQFHYA